MPAADTLKDIVIVGGKTAGWMTAAALVRLLHGTGARIRLVETAKSEAIGVGAATTPAFHDFNRTFAFDEREFMRASQATFKLGIEFANWARVGDAYLHPFSSFGQGMNGVDFHHYWRMVRESGDGTPISAYCLASAAAKLGRFALPQSDSNSIHSSYAYALHLDEVLHANYLRRSAESLGVARTEGRVVDVTLRGEDGFIESVTLEDGQVIGGELFIDCSGARGVLIEQALGTGYEDWSSWLACDRIVAVASEPIAEPEPYTRATAYKAGWQWHIPLQHSTGNGFVYSSRYLSDDEATGKLLANVEGDALADPGLRRVTSGRRNKAWNRNCVAIGESAAYLEPLQSTSIGFIQAGIMQLAKSFPDKRFAQIDIDAFNRAMEDRFEQDRDFLILHYTQSVRDDSDFRSGCRNMSVPDGLAYRVDVFRRRGHVIFSPRDDFVERDWLAVLLGQNVIPESWDPRVECLERQHVVQRLYEMKTAVTEASQAMPKHARTIAEHCPANKVSHA